MKRRACSVLLGLLLGALLWSAPGSAHAPAPSQDNGASIAAPDPARFLSVAPPATLSSEASAPSRIAERALGVLLLLSAVGIVFGALRFLSATSPARALVLGCAPVALLAGGYLLLVEDTSGVRQTPTATIRTVPPDVASVERGRALFAANCVACHGPQGRGDGPLAPTLNPRPANLADPHMAAHRDADLYGFISNGVPGSGMTAWGGQLTERERWDLVTYIRAFAPPTGGPAGTRGGRLPPPGGGHRLDSPASLSRRRCPGS